MSATSMPLTRPCSVLRIAVNRADGPVGNLEQKAVQGLIESVKLRAE